MAYPPSERRTIYAAAQAGLATLETEPEKQSKYADFIDYHANLSQEGRLEGRQEGEARLLRRLLTLRFGPPPGVG
jgi:hypothetical protein